MQAIIYEDEFTDVFTKRAEARQKLWCYGFIIIRQPRRQLSRKAYVLDYNGGMSLHV